MMMPLANRLVRAGAHSPRAPSSPVLEGWRAGTAGPKSYHKSLSHG
jgi:hypothetical protein